MVIPEELAAFIDSDGTAAFTAKNNEYLSNFIHANPHIVMTQLLGGRYVIGYIERERIGDVAKSLGPDFVSYSGMFPLVLGLLNTAAVEAAGILQLQEQQYLNLRGRGVLVAIIDTGIDYTHPAFLNDDGTSRIRYIYDQTRRGDTPEGFYVGSEYTGEQIDEALRSPNPYAIVPHRDTVGHGTFLASVAAGRGVGDNIGAAPESELIVVKLKEARPYIRERFLVPPEQENAFESSSVMAGVEYVLQKARVLNMPVAICIGVGTNFGGHDGFSIFEEYLGDISNLRGVCLCTSVGNESNAKHHTQGELAAAGEDVNIEVKAGYRAGNIFISLWNGASDRLSVSVRSPTGELIGRVPAKTGTSLHARLVLESARVVVEYYFPIEGNGSQLTAIKILDATPGIWTIIVHGDIVLDGTFHAWLPITGFVSSSVEFLEPDPYFTAVVPSTAIGTIACGAHSLENSLGVTSSWGPTRLPIVVPDLVAPGINISGALPAGGYGLMSGSSVATAITTGACALFLQWGIADGNDTSLSTSQIRAFLIRGCRRLSALTYPNLQWGYGQLDLVQSFGRMREL